MSFPRFQEVVLPILRDALGEGVTVSSWVNDIDYRKYPIVNVRRLGGYRSHSLSQHLDQPVIEMTVYHDQGIVEAEELYAKALDALFQAWHTQKVTDAGSISFVRETMGMTQFSSLFSDSWRIQGLIQLGIRPSSKE